MKENPTLMTTIYRTTRHDKYKLKDDPLGLLEFSCCIHHLIIPIFKVIFCKWIFVLKRKDKIRCAKVSPKLSRVILINKRVETAIAWLVTNYSTKLNMI